MTLYDHVLVPVDGSDEATHAARRGLELARQFGATVDVLHVVGRKTLRLTETADERRRLRERGERVLDEIEELASELDQPVTTELTEGTPASRIGEYAEERNADLVVIGRQGVTGLGKRLLGGVTEGVLATSDVPVFVVPHGDRTTEDEDADYARVLLPTDGSENATAAARHAATVARTYGSTVHVLNVVDLQASGGLFSAGGLEREFVERLESEGQEAIEEVADEVAGTASGVEVRTAVERTTSFEGAAAGIHEYVTDNDIDLVVMGSHGRSNLQRQVIGSVASTVLRTVDVPVVVVTRPSP
ncbi:universal stress protein [Halalkalicoccus paucihalophilus]|uniref:Universal stress protein n=1 Tax=Halalkalicoccus paucihalophilus TaxID=1008153 RepID=A0A151AIJ6_9EURY|nr:universal stress protein [Halalkalicoccus paucihalophilus]